MTVLLPNKHFTTSDLQWTRAALGLAAFILVLTAQAGTLYLDLPRTGLAAADLGLIVNESDPSSVRIAEYYQKRRGIPMENILRVRFPFDGPNLPRETFITVREALVRQTPPHIQAYALAWTRPYRVDCMSITSAMAFGFDESFCSARRCATTRPSDYFNSASVRPFADHGIRPAMMLAGKTFDDVKRLIDRGVSSDYTYPGGVGYLLNTSDKSRSVRSVLFGDALATLGKAFRLQRLDADSIRDKQDVLFYFTGSKQVDGLPSLRFAPGAMADHLTSAGGVLDGDSQMSSLRWLEAGASGSYGAVVEPCNHLQKFPHPALAMWHYAKGNSLIEAYWKSVAWPGEGVFVGEPLARPFAPTLRLLAPGQAMLSIYSPTTRHAILEESDSPIGPYRSVASLPIEPGFNAVGISIPERSRFYRIALPD